MQISVVAPAYKCGDCIAELHRQLVETLEPLVYTFEVIFVDDGCPENSWEAIQAVASRDPRVKAVQLSRNFGQHYAIAAGVHHAVGEWIVVMDCDLQDRPSEIGALYRKALEGYDIVFALRRDRQDRWDKRFISRMFSCVYNFFSSIQIDPRACNFSIASRQVIDSYCRLNELNRSYHLLLRWLGYRTTYLEVEHSPRFAGRSAYNLARSFSLAVESITSQSNKPLVLSIRLGFFMAATAVLAGVYYIMRYLTHHIGVEGWTTVVVSIYFIGGMTLATLGVIGLYLGKVFNEVKARPVYIVRDRLNFDSTVGIASSEDAGLEIDRSQTQRRLLLQKETK